MKCLTDPAMTRSAPKPPIRVVDVRTGGPLRHAREGAERALALRDACLAFLPTAARPLVPTLDRIARRWLKRSRSPYVAEIEAIATALGFPGIWFLNGSYQWGCTSLARDEGGVPWLARTLDWPFPGLGRHVEIARMSGAAGAFLSATWPGYVGALTGMAPGRFAACVNQAPMWRRTVHPWLRPYDIAANALRTWSLRHIPPDQLLRQAFETCETFAQARHLLEKTPVSRPVIYTLVGCSPGERCIIERTEEDHASRDEETSTANDWLRARTGWEGRMRVELLLSCSFAEAAEQSRLRRATLAQWDGALAASAFEWVAPPVLNPYTRLAAVMCPARGVLRVVGYEVTAGPSLPEPVTQVCEITEMLVTA